MVNTRTIAMAAGLGLLLSSVAAGSAAATQNPTQTNSNGPVTVAVTPIQVVPGEPVTIKVVLDTHSVDLSGIAFDRVVLLRTGAGLVAPTRIESAKGEGHHREAVLVFPSSAVARDAKTLEVLVKDVGGVAERRFAFDVPLSGGPAAQAGSSPGARGMTAGGGMMGGQAMGGGHMMGMMQQMGTLMQEMGAHLSIGQLSPDDQKAMGDLMLQMGSMMGHGMMGDGLQMQERMRAMQQRMGEMPRAGQPAPSPR